MKGILTVFFTLFISFSGVSKDSDDPVVWSQKVHKISDTEYQLVLQAKIAPKWHLYSQHTAEGGSLATEFTYVNEGENFDLVGETQESETQTQYSEIFEVKETYFSNNAVFIQKINNLKSGINTVQLKVFYQVCKEVCITRDETFVFSLNGAQAVLEEQNLDAHSLAKSSALQLDLKNKDVLKNSKTNANKKSGLLGIFGLGFLGGLIALLTPCVFPMIPLTVSFFTKQSHTKSKGIINATLYGVFIILIYLLLSLPFHLFDSVDSQILNTIATNVWLNLAFFVVFVFFAFSFFGYYELTLPSSWANKMDAASSKAGGFIGIFFMAVTLAIVSFSCTGPILGGLLGSTTLAEGDVANNLSAGMVGFGAALALPFALFAMFPAWLNALPKSGGWMTTVKVVLGFLELGLAIKFLSNADLVGDWGVFKRELFLGIWILLSVALAAYLFGLFRFPHDGPKQKLSKGRKITGILSVAFAVYLILGMAKITNLHSLSGFPPPEFYSIYSQDNDCPLGLNCFKDFEDGVAFAKQENKPILLDFTGMACVNCRKMEENVWSDPEVYGLLKNDYVLISLYVDFRKKLPKKDQFVFKYPNGRVKTIETIGQKWGTFQDINFNAASQPYYVLLSPELEILNEEMQSTDKDTYKLWLEQGLQFFNAYTQ